jgi:hypothetical protein
VQTARTEDTPLHGVLREHLGPELAGFPVVSASWQGYDLVNVQVGLNGWLAGWRREHELVGLTGYQNESFGLADLLQPGAERMWLGMGSVAMAALPAGPAGTWWCCRQR